MIAIKAGARVTAVILLAAAIALGSGAIDPVRLLVPGYHGTGRDLVAHDFGRTRIGESFPYDGQQVYLAARQLPDLRGAGRVVDSPRYRLVRILLPLLAAVGGTGTPVILLILFWNAVGIGIGVAGLTDLATRHGRPERAGLAVIPALVFPLLISTTECLAFGLGLAGLALVDRRRWGAAIACLALAGLSRETALTFAVAGGGAAWLAHHRRPAVMVAALSSLPLLGWSLVVRSVVHRGPTTPIALFGFAQNSHFSTPDIAVTALLVVLGAIAMATWRDVPAAWLSAAGFLAWFLVYQPDTFDWWALLRVSAPLVALGLAGFARAAGAAHAPEPASA